jgi:hypothetical protein
MQTISSNGTRTSPAVAPKFQIRSTSETLEELQKPIDPRHFRTRKQGNTTITYVPWAILSKCLTHRAPGWSWEIQNVQEIADCVVVTGRLSIPCSDGLLHFSALASEPLNGKTMCPAVETAASGCLRRACALAQIGIDLWIGGQ